MNRTKIEWVKNPDGSQGYTLNSKTGCLNHTPEGLCLGGLFPCYAYRLTHGRLKARYLANHNIPDGGFSIIGGRPVTLAGCGYLYEKQLNDPFYPRWWPERLKEIYHLGKGQFGMAIISKGIFLDDMSDWMADYWPREWTELELQAMRDNPQHRFYTLTKQPQNLPAWSPFPDNCWVGVTVTNFQIFARAMNYLSEIKAKVKFISFEPLLEQITSDEAGKYCFAYLVEDLKHYLNWLIIGSQTKPYKPPKIEWVEEIVRAADRAGIPVFLKDNLRPLLQNSNGWTPAWVVSARQCDGTEYLRQEMPTEKAKG